MNDSLSSALLLTGLVIAVGLLTRAILDGEAAPKPEVLSSSPRDEQGQ